MPPWPRPGGGKKTLECREGSGLWGGRELCSRRGGRGRGGEGTGLGFVCFWTADPGGRGGSVVPCSTAAAVPFEVDVGSSVKANLVRAATAGEVAVVGGGQGKAFAAVGERAGVRTEGVVRCEIWVEGHQVRGVTGVDPIA